MRQRGFRRRKTRKMKWRKDGGEEEEGTKEQEEKCSGRRTKEQEEMDGWRRRRGSRPAQSKLNGFWEGSLLEQAPGLIVGLGKPQGAG